MVRTRPQGRRGGGGGSTDPKMVAQNNVLCRCRRRRRFCFRHPVRGKLLFSPHVCSDFNSNFNSKTHKATSSFCWGPSAWGQCKLNNFASHFLSFFFLLPRFGVAPQVADTDSHAFVGPLELGIRTPTLLRGPLGWGYGLPRFWRGPLSWGYGLPRLAWPLELGIPTPTLLCGPSSWGYELPHFWPLTISGPIATEREAWCAADPVHCSLYSSLWGKPR